MKRLELKDHIAGAVYGFAVERSSDEPDYQARHTQA